MTSERLSTTPAWILGLTDGLCIGAAAGFYLWMLGGPTPAAAVIATTQKNLLAGLPRNMLIGEIGGLAIAAGLNMSATTQGWRTKVALASCGFYLAATSVIISGAALALAPACALGWLVMLLIRNEKPQGGGTLVALHAGALGTALAFFHQWTWYRHSWDPFVANLAALRKLWFGG